MASGRLQRPGKARRTRGYAAGYPETQDLYLSDTAQCDPVTGHFLPDAQGKPILRGVGVLVRWDQVAYLEFIEA